MKTWLIFLCLVSLTRQQESGNRPLGIFIQVSSANTWVLPNLARWLDNICARNRELPVNQRMNDLVLQDVATEVRGNAVMNYTMHFDVLDVIAPYFPGGSKHCFGNVFVGTIEVAWKGAGELYFDAVQNAAFRQRNIELSAQVAKEFKNRYATTHLNWYITYEANLNYLVDEKCLKGYSDLLSGLGRVLTSIQSGSVMWSPAFWDTWETTIAKNISKLRTNLNSLFTTVKTKSSPGINWMDLQDSLGKSSVTKCTGLKTTQNDAINLFRFLKSVYKFTSIQMNAELFKYNQNCTIVESEATRQVQLEQVYWRAGIKIGAAWEIRFWRERGGNF